MKWIIMLLLAVSVTACSTTQTEEILGCDRMVTCTLVGCDGQLFGTVDIPACDAESFVEGCCRPRPDITCNCPGR